MLLKIFFLKIKIMETSLVVQWLRLHASTAGAAGLIPGWGTKIPRDAAKKKKKKYIFFSSAHGTFSRIDYILGHKSSLGKFKKTEIISSIFPTTTL